MRIRLVALTIFILFFGIATLDAIASRNWVRSIFWLAIGVGFLVLDNLRKPLHLK